MCVSLTPELERLVNERVESGLYQTASGLSERHCTCSRNATKHVSTFVATCRRGLTN